ncbi:MAG: fibronectin type III domain-containing protein [Chloroflexi bacterium]|nr:fibronectin type III domain-containing protein [Chloroflexota bacterium]
MRWDGNDTIYAIPGNNSIAFYKYIISRNQWVRLNDLASPAGPESAIGLMGNNHFIVSLNYSTINYIYDAALDSFDENVPAPGNFTTSSNLYFDGVDTVYAMMESNWLRKFVISENRWYSLMQAPAFFGDSQNISFEGLGNDLYMYASRNAHQYMAAKYSISNNKFTQITSPPMETSQTSYIVTDNIRYVYILQNCIDSFRQDNMMIRYDTVLDKYTPDIYSPGRSYYYDRSSWDPLYGSENAKPFYTDTWTSMAFDGVDTVYYKNYDTIVSYSVSAKKQINSWKNIYYNYGHIAYSSGYLYMTIGSGSNRFVRQNLKTYGWEELANAPGNLNLAYTQNLLVDSTGRLYVAQAGGSKVIYRYLPASNTWETIADAPVALNTGSNMVYDGNNRIYFTFGGSTSRDYYYYNISSNGWTSRANIIDDIPGSGAVQMYYNGKVYLLKGKGLDTMSVYDTSANTWVAGPVAPTTVNRGSGFVAVNSQFALMAPAGAKGAVWRFNYPDATKGNNSYGTYTSRNFLIEGVFSYVGLEANLNIPNNTAIIFQTRTTPDGTTWSNWQDVSDKKLSSSHLLAQINSPLQKNIQVRAILISYNGYDSPTLYDFKVNYFSDTSPPNNPTVLSVYQNDQKSTELTNNTWYNISQPYIDWPEPGEAGGATDGVVGSNISGYYIYVGSDVAAVPESQGVLVNVSNYQPTLATSGLYYINIQAVDGSGNVAEAVFSPYLYKFDIDKPANPASISSDPAGYSNTNSFSFNWPVAQDTHSGIKEYCYKTAATEGAYSVEQCQSGTSINAIPAAYQQGANILYVRAHDYADNYSDSTQEVTFYFNSGPPSRPSNLTVDPVNTIQNSFTFDWDPPAAYIGNVDKISYFYSINALPSVSNTTRVETKSIGPAAFATQAGANGFYLVAKDESGNIDWNAYASVTFYANTVAPGVPVNPTIADISSRASSRWALAISWDQPANLGSGVDHYIIERSTDKFRYNQIGTADAPAFVDTVVSENTEYYYRIKAADSVNNPSPASSVVSLSPTGKYAEPPEIASGPDVEIGSNQVTIRWQTSRPCFGYVNYGSAHDKLVDNKGSNEEITDHVVTITGIMANTVYYYKIQNFDADREYQLSNSYSILRTFRSKQSPIIQDVKVSDIKLDSALISWSAQSIVNYNILYGKSVFYGLSKEGNTTGENVSVSLTDLEHSSNYHFKIVAMSVDGDEIRSDDYNFNTMSYPQASDIKFQPVDGPTTSVEVSWKTNVRATSIVSYQIDADIKEQSDGAFLTDHKIVITGLADNAEYRIQIKGVDEYGNNVVSEVATWRTAVDTRPPVVTNIKVDPTYNSSGNKSQLIVTWETDEPSSSQIEFGMFGKDKGYQSKNTNDVNLTTKHIMIIPDLETATAYHLRPLSQDKSGNVGYGQDTIAVIGQNQKSFVRAIFLMFESLFSWLSINK